jgi:hypothetical protein
LGSLIIAIISITPALTAPANKRTAKPTPILNPADYHFSRVHPPLLQQLGGRVTEVPDENLQVKVGKATWTDKKEYDIEDLLSGHPREVLRKGGWYRKITTDFELTRIIPWVRVTPVRHLITDDEITVQDTTGYDKTQEENFTAALETNLKAGTSAGPEGGFGLSVEVKGSLQMNKKYTEQWHVVHSETKKRTWHGGRTYVMWKLLDSLYLKKLRTEGVAGNAWNPWITTTTPTNQQLDLVENEYEDCVLDSGAVCPRTP